MKGHLKQIYNQCKGTSKHSMQDTSLKKKRTLRQVMRLSRRKEQRLTKRFTI